MSNAVGCSGRADAVVEPFAAYAAAAAVTQSAVHWTGQFPKTARFPWGIWNPSSTWFQPIFLG